MQTGGGKGSHEEHEISERHRSRLPIPLNSKRLTAEQLRRLARAMNIPTTAATDEVRQMVEGKLSEDGREPWNVQVVLDGTTPLDAFTLQDEEGEFLTVSAAEVADIELLRQADSEREDEEGDLEYLRTELEATKVENSELRQQVSQEKTRFRELWRTNCQCLADYDEMIHV